MTKQKISIQAFGGPEKFDPSKVNTRFTYDRVDLTNKPGGEGLWTSTYVPKEEREYPNEYSAWARWSIYEDFLPYKYQSIVSILYPKEDTKVFTIDSYEDLVKASKPIAIAYPEIVEQYLSYRRNFLGELMVIDFSSLFQSYDGIHVTERAAMMLHRFGLEYFDGSNHIPMVSLNCWDCESTVWRDANWIDHVEYETVEQKKYILRTRRGN